MSEKKVVKRESYSIKSFKKNENETVEEFKERLYQKWVSANTKIPNRLQNVVIPQNWESNDFATFLSSNPKLNYADYQMYLTFI